MPPTATATLQTAGAALSDTAARINAAHAGVKRSANSMVQFAQEAGALLLQAKAECAHGCWLPWLAENCPDISERSAQAYMRVARASMEGHAQASALEHGTLQKALLSLAKPKASTPAAAADLPDWLPASGQCAMAVLPGDTYVLLGESEEHPGYFDVVQIKPQEIEWMRRPCRGDMLSTLFHQLDPPNLEWRFQDRPLLEILGPPPFDDLYGAAADLKQGMACSRGGA
ncbi:MAG TPA: DUF3102 domain-containing protein [Nevskia sp.]|nr:DUF3102 domain-containing protein [Nevskia sp.]